MDRQADVADILFQLTTSRPDILELALTPWPGRMDQCYRDPIARCGVSPSFVSSLCPRTDTRHSWSPKCHLANHGVSAEFIREMVRKAALFAADESSDNIDDRHLDEAIHTALDERLAYKWPRRDSNPHTGYPIRDFKSRASANSATRPNVFQANSHVANSQY